MKWLLIAVVLSAVLAPPAAAAPTPGAGGFGDRLFPKLGNGGYDVQHYDLALTYATAAPSQAIDGTVTITAKATQALSRFDLDFAGDSVGSVTVDGAAAAFSRSGQKLVITPAKPLRDGATFTAVVAHYTAHPRSPSDKSFTDDAFVVTPDGSATFPQPAGAHRFLPSNDVPGDKATFTFHLDVPDGETAVANGELVSRTSANGRTQYVYDSRQPMATELIQLAVGSFQVIDRGVVDGVHVRDVVSPALAPRLADRLPLELQQLAWMKARVGAYPFATYGSLVLDIAVGASLETQTLSTFDRTASILDTKGFPATMLHELSHSWFGDSVTPADWSDVWLNEGHATYYQDSWAAEHGGRQLEHALKPYYEDGDFLRAKGSPVARPKSAAVHDLFGAQQYSGGALVLYALREKVGEKTFERIEREWVTRYAGRSVTTADYIALASRVSGKHLGPFLHDWLYGTRTPPMPGHPDWRVKTIKEVEGR